MKYERVGSYSLYVRGSAEYFLASFCYYYYFVFPYLCEHKYYLESLSVVALLYEKRPDDSMHNNELNNMLLFFLKKSEYILVELMAVGYKSCKQHRDKLSN